MSERIVGGYRIERRLGGGDVGEVFAGQRQLRKNGRAAIKILRPKFSRLPEIADRFLSEMPAVGRVKEPALVDVHDHGQEDDGTTYVVFPYLEGETLTSLLEKHRGSLPSRDALSISRQIAAALSAAHAADLPHGDLHSNNVFVTADAEAPERKLVRIADFGIARVVAAYERSGQPPLARTSPACDYLAPEQRLDAKKLEQPADVYSFGVLIHVMLAGSLPSRPLADLPPSIPLDLAGLLRRMLSEKPAARPAMTEVAETLAPRTLGDFTQEGKIADDGRCVLYQVEHRPTKRQGLLRVLGPEGSKDAKQAAHFLDAAEALQHLSGPGFVEIYGRGKLPNGSAYVFTELLKGESLRARLQRQGRLGPEALPLAQQIASALARAHASGVAYLGLSPETVVLVPGKPGEEQVKLLDSETVQEPNRGQPSTAHTLADVPVTSALAPVLYLAPEQCLSGQRVDARADVYALGSLLYHMLSGSPPFEYHGTRTIEIAAMHRNQVPRPLHGKDPSISSEVSDLVQRMLSKDWAQRPPMAEVEVTLRWLVLLERILKGPPLAGRYKIVHQLGPGGCGAIFEGIDERLGRVAIKVPLPQFSADRVLQERKIIQALNDKHPGLIKLYDWDQLPDRTPYIVMEYLSGDLLATFLQGRGGRLPEHDAVRLTQQIASALAVAHAEGVVHRDLTPENVKLVPDPAILGGVRAKVFDFGIAKVAAEYQTTAGRRLTRVGVQLGTPDYMAPEQLEDPSSVTGKADVYSLGVVLYKMLGGRLPLQRPLPRVASAALMPYLERMLAVDPEYRPTMAEVAAEIESLRAPFDPNWTWRRRAAVAVLACGSVAAVAKVTPPIVNKVFPTRWEVTSEPGAAAVRDGKGKVLGKTPWNVKPRDPASDIPAGDRPFDVEVELPGYVRQKLTLDPRTNFKKHVVLDTTTWEINSEPPGAQVLDEDDVKLGTTPWKAVPSDGKIKIQGKQFPVQLMRSLYETQTLVLDTTSNTQQSVKLVPVRWTFKSDPPGATVKLEGNPLGNTPLTVEAKDLPPRSRRVVISAENCESIPYTMDPKKTEEKTAKLKCVSPVHLELTSEPAGATVLQVEGKARPPLGTTPWVRDQPPGKGTLTVELRLRGYHAETAELDLEKGGKVEVTLKRKSRCKGQDCGDGPPHDTPPPEVDSPPSHGPVRPSLPP